MTGNPSDGNQDPASPDGALPDVIPIFPLMGVLLLPGADLPLNIFEPRYLNMVRDAKEHGRIIGMIQPVIAEERHADDHPDIYGTGCAGRIADYRETEDGRILVTLRGVCRFDIAEELPLIDGYRRVKADYRRYRSDLEEPAADIDRPRLVRGLRAYLAAREASADWEAIDEATDAELVNALAAVCPFAPQERQMLLEAKNVDDRSRVMIGLLEAPFLEGRGQSQTRH